MVEIIQRYVLSATAGAGSLNCLPIMQARRFRYGLNNNHDHPLTFVENNKNPLHSKKSLKNHCFPDFWEPLREALRIRGIVMYLLWENVVVARWRSVGALAGWWKG